MRNIDQRVRTAREAAAQFGSRAALIGRNPCINLSKSLVEALAYAVVNPAEAGISAPPDTTNLPAARPPVKNSGWNTKVQDDPSMHIELSRTPWYLIFQGHEQGTAQSGHTGTWVADRA